MSDYTEIIEKAMELLQLLSTVAIAWFMRILSTKKPKEDGKG